MKHLFRRGYELTLNRVHDTVTVKEGSESLTLTVNGDSFRMVSGLNKAQEKMKALSEKSPAEDVKAAAEYFATVIFGAEQAAELMRFYADDAACVITLCGQYFKTRLADKIAKTQKKLKV